VKKGLHHDLGFPDMAFSYDATVVTPPRTCDDRVVAGALSGLTNLGPVNGSGDDTAIAVTNDGARIYYLSGGTLMTAPLTNPKTAGAPSPVSVSGLNAIYGLAFSSDGSLYVAGTATATQIFKLHLDTPTSASIVDTHLPSGLCPITGLALTNGDITKDLYVAYPLAGCNLPEGRGSYVAQGFLDKQMGTFITAMPSPGYGAPFVMAGGFTMLLSSADPGARLYYGTRPGTDAQWTGPLNLPLGAIGVGTRDSAAVVSSDCKTLYLVSERAGGKGGLDLWAADIAPQ
jgi:hypothetical protein